MFDLDDTLCTRPADITDGPEKYKTSTPNYRTIDILNRLSMDNHKIIIYTSRGMTYFKGNVDLIDRKIRPLTEEQLNDWGVEYDELIMGKPHYDVFVDDKALNAYNPHLEILIDSIINKK